MNLEREAIAQSFLAESSEGLVQVEEALLLLESRPDDLEPVQTVFRIIHTIKGLAAALDLNQLRDYTHNLEDVLDRLREGHTRITGATVTLLLRMVDVLRGTIPAAVEGHGEILPQHWASLEELKRMCGSEGPAAPPQPEAGPSAILQNLPSSHGARTLRIGLDKLDRMLDLTGEIAIAQGRLRGMLEQLGVAAVDVSETHRQIEQLFLELQDQVMRARMVPIQPLFRQFGRIVRDLARSQDKLARLAIEGEDVEVDTSVLESLRDPIVHMIRNALDHGIEKPGVRRANGKVPCGTITLRAWHDAGNIIIQVADDGGGFNRKRILERAVAMGKNLDLHRGSDERLFGLVFEPGFSTAETVTDLSGRGVGMDVVRRNIEQLRGVVRIQSVEGQGSTVTICLPLTLTIIEGFCVKAGDEVYVVPVQSLVECLELPKDQHRCEDGGVINLRGQVLPYIRLRELFGISGEAPSRENMVVVEYEGGKAGLAVDELLGEQQAVIKPLGHMFQGIPGISGSTILGNGRVALLLDLPALWKEVVARQDAEVTV